MKRLFLIGFFLISSLSFLFSATAVVTDIKGEVKVLLNGNWQNLEKDSIVEEGSKIKTGKDGFVTLVFENGSEVSLKPNTVIDLSSIDPKNVRIELSVGRIKNKVKKLSKGESYTVTTPASVCAVRGTEFDVIVDEKGRTRIEVFAGIVEAREISGIGEPVFIRENQFLEVLPGVAPSEPQKMTEIEKKPSFAISTDKREYIDEVRMDMTKEEVQDAAARELKFAEYQEGKTMIDYFGKRVRIEEYIVRPRGDQFKFVALNERENRFDYFTWKATFNKDLPEDLDLKTANQSAFSKTGDETWSTEPDYWIKEHDCAISNTVDKVEWKKERQSYSQKEQLTEWKINGKDVTPLNINLTQQDSTYAHDVYSANISLNGTGSYSYKEEYYFIDDEGNLAKREDYDANPLSYNQELVMTSDDFKGPEGKIDLVVEPEIFKKSGIR